MSIGERFAAASNRFYLRIRHPDAFAAAESAGTVPDFAALAGRKYALLTTFKRDGTPIPTPVWFGVGDDGLMYVRTEVDVGKVKRIRNDPHVRVAPASVRGKPLGPTTEARARVLPAEEEDRAEAAIAANYGLFRRLYEGSGERMNLDLAYLEITPAGAAGS